MKLWFTSDNVDWDAGRYHYAAEQMLLTLFPDERPQYPDTPAPTALDAEKNAVIFTLHRGKKLTNLSALLLRDGRWNNGVTRFPSEALDEPEERVYHTVQRAVKQSFYKAGTMLLGFDLPWGSLTGVRPVKLPTRALLAGATPAQAEKELAETFHVSAPRRKLALACAAQSVQALKSLGENEISLYIGIPFCPSRCAYCSFISADVKGALALVEPYVAALCREIAHTGDLLERRGLKVRTVYMGGGTPTTLSAPQLDQVLTALEPWLDRAVLSEFTVEAGRPDTITAEKLAVLRSHGVDRVSVNPQTLSDQVLQAMGRSHTAQQFRQAYALARSAGFEAINTDLIAGLPLDDPAGFGRTLDEIVALAPQEITVHTLALKKGSRFTGDDRTDVSHETFPDGDQVAQMLDYAAQVLPQAGYRPYYLYRQKHMTGSLENIGWTRRESGCLYNMVMMEELGSVLALGSGGVTKLVDRATGQVQRHTNPKYPKEYLERLEDILAERETLQWPTN